MRLEEGLQGKGSVLSLQSAGSFLRPHRLLALKNKLTDAIRVLA